MERRSAPARPSPLPDFQYSRRPPDRPARQIKNHLGPALSLAEPPANKRSTPFGAIDELGDGLESHNPKVSLLGR